MVNFGHVWGHRRRAPENADRFGVVSLLREFRSTFHKLLRRTLGLSSGVWLSCRASATLTFETTRRAGGLALGRAQAAE